MRLEPPLRGWVAVTVEDDRPGIPEEKIEQVFEPFHRVESRRNRETGGWRIGK